MAELLGGDAATLDTIVEAAWKDCCLETGPGYVAYHCALLSKQPLGVQRRLIRRGIAHLWPGLRDIDYETVDKALRFLQTSSRSRECDLAAGLRLFQEGDRLWLAAWEADLPRADWPRIPAGIQHALAIPGQVELEGSWNLRAELMPAEPELIQQALHNTEMYQVWLDRQSLTLPLTIRSRLPGDRFQPLGMEGHSLKLADFMINTRMPSRARSGWPLIFSGNQIVWVPGFRIGNPFAIRQTTSQLVKLVLQR